MVERKGKPSHVPSPDALEVRNLPAAFAGTTLHPPVAPTGAVPDLQDDPEDGGIGRGGGLAMWQVAAGLRIKRGRAELLQVLMLPDFERADRIGEFWSYPQSRTSK